MQATMQEKTLLPAADALSLACAAMSPLVDEYGPVTFVPDQQVDVSWTAHPPKNVVLHTGEAVALTSRWHVWAEVRVATARVVF